MAKISILRIDSKEIYPTTITDAVALPNEKKLLSTKLSEIDTSIARKMNVLDFISTDTIDAYITDESLAES